MSKFTVCTTGFALCRASEGRARTGNSGKNAGGKKTFRCFVVGPINCHSESENFLKFLLTRANLSRFNPGDVSWITPFQGMPPGDFGRKIEQFRSSEAAAHNKFIVV